MKKVAGVAAIAIGLASCGVFVVNASPHESGSPLPWLAISLACAVAAVVLLRRGKS